MQKDNSPFAGKVAERRLVLREIAAPVIMECYGGLGKIWRACYSEVGAGVVFEKDPARAGILGLQRPTWAVYEADCVVALQAGAGAHLVVNLLDLDPYGEPWPAVDAFFASTRPRAPELWVVVNDGLRQKIKATGGWDVASLQPMVARYGISEMCARYLDVCREMLQEKAAPAGYRLDRFQGRYCGHAKQMTHYLARLILDKPPDRA
jgi:hypothetical protein